VQRKKKALGGDAIQGLLSVCSNLSKSLGFQSIQQVFNKRQFWGKVNCC